MNYCIGQKITTGTDASGMDANGLVVIYLHSSRFLPHIQFRTGELDYSEN
jgi:hypothetical protein